MKLTNHQAKNLNLNLFLLKKICAPLSLESFISFVGRDVVVAVRAKRESIL